LQYQHRMNETRQIIASLPDYDGAQAVVDDLAEKGFPVDGLAIVGVAIQICDGTTGRRRHTHPVFGGMVTGAVVGAMVGWLLGVLNLVESLATALSLGLWGLVIGAALGTGLGAVGRVWVDAESEASPLRPVRYDVLAPQDAAADASRAVEELLRIRHPVHRP
jgi:hypothetical protein